MGFNAFGLLVVALGVLLVVGGAHGAGIIGGAKPPAQQTVGGGGATTGQTSNPQYGIGSRNAYAFGNGGGYNGQKLPNPNNAINPEPHAGR